MSERTHDVGTELRRGVVATALGVGLGLLVTLFARRGTKEKGRRWRGRSAT